MIGPLKQFPDLRDHSPLNGGNATYLEDLYGRYLDDPNTVEEQWRHYFDALGSHSTSQTESTDTAAAGMSEAAAAKQEIGANGRRGGDRGGFEVHASVAESERAANKNHGPEQK